MALVCIQTYLASLNDLRIVAGAFPASGGPCRIDHVKIESYDIQTILLIGVALLD